MTTSTLLLMLGILLTTTITSCSKVPQGLRFPLDVRGIFTTKYFQKLPTRDSSNLVKPFMHVAIQTTRHYAQSCYIKNLISLIRIYTNEWKLYVSLTANHF